MPENAITRLTYSVTRYFVQDVSTQRIRRVCVEAGKGIAPDISEPITIGVLLKTLSDVKEINLPEEFKSYDSNNFPYYAFESEEDYRQWQLHQNHIGPTSTFQTTEKSSSE